MSIVDFFKGKSTMPRITITENINVDKYPWCNSAIMFSVKNGKDTLKHVYGKIDKVDYQYNSHLMLNGFPLLQAEKPVCPTCLGLLAVGYGIENINCSELEQVRQAVNSDYVNINKSVEILSPLLGLLSDGIYLLADIPYFPTNGDGKFFYDIPNEPTMFTGTCQGFYFNELYCTVDGFPAYLYPTQSDKLINRERVNYYTEIIKRDGKLPRGIAYYEGGFFSALLDGHHKAVAAAICGEVLNCLTIIKANGYNINKNEGESLLFSAIKVPFDNACKITKKTRTPIEEFTAKNYTLIHNLLTDMKFKTEEYPDIEELTAIYAVGLEDTEIMDKLTDKWFEDNKSDVLRLKYALIYFSKADREKAYKLAKMIIADGSYGLPYKEAYRALLKDRSQETEDLFVDYLINKDSSDECWDIVNSYWDIKDV